MSGWYDYAADAAEQTSEWNDDMAAEARDAYNIGRDESVDDRPTLAELEADEHEGRHR